MFYKNISYSAKTFHGVTFKPGEIKEVRNYINDRLMIIVDDVTAKQNKVDIQQKPSSEIKESVPTDTNKELEAVEESQTKDSGKKKSSTKEHES